MIKNFMTLKYFFIANKWAYIFGVVWLIMVDVLQLIVPEILRNFTDKLQNNMLSREDVFKYGFYMLLIGFLLAFFRFLWRIFIIGTSKKLEFELRNKLFNNLLNLSTGYFNKSKTGDLMAHATNDINAIRMALGPGIIMLTDAIFISVVAIIMMFLTTDVRLTIMALIPMPILAVFVTKFGKVINNRFRMVQESFSSLTETTQENLSGIRVIKSFVQEKEEVKKFNEKNMNVLNKNMYLVKIFGLFNPFVFLVSSLSYIIVTVYGGTLVIYGRISLGDFVAFNSYLALLIWPIMAAGWVVNIMQRGSASMERINKILDETSDIVSPENGELIDNKDISVSFENVSLKYPNTDEYALKNISFDLKEGSSLGVIGKTGSGKTTIASSILRLFDIDSGEIRISGYPIKNIDIESLRSNIGYVDQDSFLFSTTIEDNIAFGVEKATNEEVVRVAELAYVHQNIMDFPDNYKTFVGERGVTLSGGQKQRISIARALIKEPKLLILDDSLSAVDTNTEEKILKNLKNELEGKTNIIIAHRISTIKNCDNIIVLDNGEVVEEGKHDELIKKRGLYNDLYQKQLLEEEIK